MLFRMILKTKDIVRVMENWGSQHPEDAANWLKTAAQKLTENQLVAAEKLISSWSEIDALAGSAWLQQLPPGLLRDHGAKGLAEAAAAKDGPAAAEWVESIQNQDIRSLAAEGVVARWRVYDETGALPWLEALNAKK